MGNQTGMNECVWVGGHAEEVEGLGSVCPRQSENKLFVTVVWNDAEAH